jgi:hypothetical protein
VFGCTSSNTVRLSDPSGLGRLGDLIFDPREAARW